MKSLQLSVVSVLVLALLIGLAFHSLYPHVEPSAELAGLFGFVALLLKLGASGGWALWRRWQTARQARVAAAAAVDTKEGG